MGVFELFVLAVGLSMDAFAVAVCKGLALKRSSLRDSLLVGLWFGGFQALMPLIGYLAGVRFRDAIMVFDHWIAFVLLVLIGANMIREAFSKDEGEETDASLSVRKMLPLAVATSIDALAIGVTFAFLDVKIGYAISFIGCTTFVISAVGVKIGRLVGERFKSRAELVGGAILIVLGIKILAEHLIG